MANHKFGRLNVLVVDDNKHTLNFVGSILWGLGFRNVIRVTDAALAFSHMRTNPIDLVITDLDMPLLTGVEFVRLLRTAKDSPNPYVPVIMLTGHSRIRDIAAAREAGITDYLIKPISPKRLYERIDSIIEHPRSFVQTKSYVGPDRRRRKANYSGPERRYSMACVNGGVKLVH